MPLTDQTVAAVTGALASLPVSAESQSLSHGTTLLTLGLTIDAPASRVWDHLTQPELLALWSPIVPDRPLTEVGPAQSHETPDAPTTEARVIELEPGTVLRHAWGMGEVLWELTESEVHAGAEAADGPTGGSAAATHLALTQTFAQQDLVPMTAAGWHECFTVLSLVLDGQDVERVVGEDALAVGWEALRDAYVRNFNPTD